MKTRFREKVSFLGISLLFFLGNSGFGQVDSLIRVVRTMPDSEEKAKVYKDIAFSFYYSDPDKCILYCDTLEAISKRINYKRGLASHFYLRSIAYYIKEDYKSAIDNCELALTANREQEDTGNELIVLDFLGTIYRDMGFLENALEYQLTSLKLAERIGDTIGIGYASHNIGNLFFDMKDHESAQKYYKRGIDYLQDSKEYTLLAQLYNGYSLKEDGGRALKPLKKALEYAKLTGDNYHAIAIYQNIGSHFHLKKNFIEAIKYFGKAFLYATEFEATYYITQNANAIGEAYMLIGQLDSAQYYLDTALKYAEDNEYEKELEDSYYLFSKLYEKQNNPTIALQYLNLAYDLDDTLYNQEIINQLQTNAAKYEFEKNQRQIAEQQLQIAQSKNTRNAIIFGALILLFGVAAIYQRYLSQQRKKQQAAEFALTTQQAESQRLRELDQLKTNFFTNISHELRTPLTLILSPLTDVMNGIKSNPIKQKLQVIQNNGQRLLGLVNEIMDLSKLEAGKLEINAVRVELLPLIKRLFSTFESLAVTRNITYQSNFNIEPSTTVKLDIDKFEKIINNLIGNALKYNVSGGSVMLDVRANGNQFEFKITDTGKGIAEEDLPHIFNRFYQSKTKSQDLQGGTGIGLALSKELTELLDGALMVESELGKGSTFILKLPLEIVENVTVSKIAVDPIMDIESTFIAPFQPIFINGEKPKILVVEDNPEMSTYLVQVLSAHYQCTAATDGQAALKQLKLYNFDAILSDVMMPNMDGFEFRAQINKDVALRQIPFLMLTARSLGADKIKGLQLGVDDYMTKPFSTNELNARLQNLIKNKLERDEFLKSQNTDSQEVEVLSADQQILQQAESIILKNIDDPKFKVPDLAKEIGYSSKQLGRIIKQLTGFSTVGFILEIRLQKARTLLEKRIYPTVLEVQYEVGINSTSYFTRKFTERFGKNPKELVKR